MKNIFRKLSSTNVSITYMFILLGVSTLMMVGYFSYAWFTVQGVQKYSVVTGTLTGTLAIGSNTASINGSGIISYTPSTNSDTLTVTVTNTSDRTVKNSLYYYTLSNSSITIGYASDSSTIPSVTGVSVDKGKSLTYKIRISGANGKTIKIGSSMGLNNSNLSLPSGTSAFDVFKMTGKVSDVLLAGVGANGTIDTSDSEQTFITGTDPNNYIWYSGKLWRAVSIDPSDNSVKLVTQWNISTLSYNASNNTAFKGSYMEKWLNDTSVDGFLGNLRETNKFIKTDSVWNATLTTTTTKPAKTTMITDAVGLLNIYEYTMSYKNATSSTGYLNNGLYWWTLTPYNTSGVRILYYDGGITAYEPTNLYGARPSINLKSTVKIIDGDGTSDNPFKLEGDNDKISSGAKLTTRYSGEYISFGTGENNLYRIVNHENGTGTKIVSAIPLKDNNIYKNLNFGNNLRFSKNNTIGTFLNSDYLTSGTYLTSDKVNMIEDNTTWYLGTIGDGANYKLSKYQNATGSTLTTSTTTAKVGLLRLGELMAGQFDKFANSIGYWTLTPYSTSYVRTVQNIGNASFDGKADLNGYRPSMNLKSNVVITGGTGTKSDPFTIKLG